MTVNDPDVLVRASALWQNEVNQIAADLLGRGEAVSPADAVTQAEKLVQARRRDDAAHVDTLAKRFDGAGPIIGGHGV